VRLPTLKQITDLQQQAALAGVKGEPLHLTHLMAGHILSAYLAVLKEDIASLIQKIAELSFNS